MAKIKLIIPDVGRGPALVSVDGLPIEGVTDYQIDWTCEDATTVTITLLAMCVDIEQDHEGG